MSTTDPMFDPDDLFNEDFRCVHGTFIGNPYGADYLCFHCEMGTSPEEYAALVQTEENRQIRRAVANRFLIEAFHETYTPLSAAPPALLHTAMGLVRAFGSMLR